MQYIIPDTVRLNTMIYLVKSRISSLLLSKNRFHNLMRGANCCAFKDSWFMVPAEFALLLWSF